MQETIETDEIVLESVRGLFDASEFVTREEFRSFVTPYFSYTKHVESLQWAPRVTGAVRSEFERNIEISELKGNVPVRAMQREEYFPVYYDERQDGPATALGFDLASDPVLRAAIHQSQATGKHTIAGPVSLNRSEAMDAGFLVFLPTYEKDIPVKSIEDRRKALRGLVLISFRLEDLVERNIPPSRFRDMELRLYDHPVAGGNTLLVSFPSGIESRADRGVAPMRPQSMQHEKILKIGGREWLLSASPSRHFLSKYKIWLIPVILLAMGLVLTVLLASYLIHVQRSRSNLEREIAQRRKAELEAESANKAKSQFLTNMSHELRTPLNSVIGFSEVLQDEIFGPLNEKQKDYVRDILSSGNHLLSLINDILDLSKIESGKTELSLSTFRLKEMLEDSMILFKDKALKHQIELSTDIAEDLDSVKADERKVKQIVFNLLSNAVKFTPDGGKIGIRARRKDDRVEVSVSDTGVGISHEDQARLFGPFIQIENIYTKKQHGTGLGLFLSLRLAELHQGTIRVESEGTGKGSTFVLSLPLITGQEG